MIRVGSVGTGISVTKNGDILYDKYFGLGYGGAAYMAFGVGVDNGAAPLGWSHDQQYIGQAGLGKFGGSISHSTLSGANNLGGGVAAGPRFGLHLARTDTETYTEKLGSINCY
jgi:hypothetical protein